MRRLASGSLAAAVALCALAPAASADAPAIASSTAFASAASDLAVRGVIGAADGSVYAPGGTLSRADFVKLVVVAVGLAPVQPATPTFTDVAPSDWAFGYVEAAAKAGLVSGNGNSTFAPGAPITREQAAAMLVRALGKQGSLNAHATLAFADAAAVDGWAVPYIDLAAQSHLLSPDNANDILAGAPLSRADAIVAVDTAFFGAAVNPVTVPGYRVSVLARGTSTMKGPDDITRLGDHIFVPFQNGVGAKGEASTSGGTASTIAEYDLSGHLVNSWNVTGKCDGLTADPANNRVIGTLNEDGNSSMFLIYPTAAAGQQVQNITYSAPLAHGGGTDSISVMNGSIYVAASAPTPDANGNFKNAALYQVTIQGNTASLQPALMGNATATDAASGNPVTLNLSDPDSSAVVPAASPMYAGTLALDSQGDSQVIFVQNPGGTGQTQTRLTTGTQIDDMTWATAAQGTLYVVDAGANAIYAVSGTFTPGTAFVAAPNDSGVAGFVGTLDLSSGTIHPWTLGLSSPKGLLFVPQSSQ